MVQKIVPQPKDTSKLADSKVAAMFDTNRTYINQASKIKETAPVRVKPLGANRRRAPFQIREIRVYPHLPLDASPRACPGGKVPTVEPPERPDMG
jgi:hypothetical protein